MSVTPNKSFFAQMKSASDPYDQQFGLLDGQSKLIATKTGEWQKRYVELSNPKRTENSQKPDLKAELDGHIKDYLNFNGTQKTAKEILDGLTTTINSLSVIQPLTERSLMVLEGLGGDVSGVCSKYKEFTDELTKLHDQKTKIETVYNRIIVGIPEAAHALEPIAKYVATGGAIEWGITASFKYRTNSTSYLNLAIADYKERQKIAPPAVDKSEKTTLAETDNKESVSDKNGNTPKTEFKPKETAPLVGDKLENKEEKKVIEEGKKDSISVSDKSANTDTTPKKAELPPLKRSPNIDNLRAPQTTQKQKPRQPSSKSKVTSS